MSMVDKIYLHPSADVALLVIDSPTKSREPLYFSPTPGKAREAFAMGFPWGRPGGWSGNYMGQARAVHRGVHTGSEQVTVWSEATRIPHEKPHMGGISGGAVFDDSGNVIGIAIGGNPRRGRHDVSTLATIEPFLQDRKVSNPQTRTSMQSPYTITPYNYPVFIKSHIRNNRIAKVLCHNG